MRAAAALAALALAGCVEPERLEAICPEGVTPAVAAQCAGAAQAHLSFAVEKSARADTQARLKARSDALSAVARSCRDPGAVPDRGLITGFPTEAEVAQDRAVADARSARLAALRERYGYVSRGDVPDGAYGPEPAACAAIAGG